MSEQATPRPPVTRDQLRTVAASLIASSRFPSRRIGTDDLLLLGENLNALLDAHDDLVAALGALVEADDAHATARRITDRDLVTGTDDNDHIESLRVVARKRDRALATARALLRDLSKEEGR